MILATSACAGNRAVPASGIGADNAFAVSAPDAVDTTSILKQLTTTVTIGSTVDAKNGDKAPHALLVARASGGKIKKGQIVACNFSNKSNAAGQGTTIEVLNAKAGSSPTQIAQNAAAKGCAALGITAANTLLDATFGGKSIAQFDATGAYTKIANKNIVAPFGATYSSIGHPYPRLILFATDASKGTVLRIDMTTGVSVTPIATGFAVNKKPGTSALGPSGLSYNVKTDTLYIVDGVDNTVIAFKNVGQGILLANAVTVLPGGKTFKYANGIKPFASVVYAGSALKSPVASTLLPNGNLIVANTKGNGLVELTTTGTVLATKVAVTGATPAVFGLAASGTTDANTVLYFTNAVANTVQELTK
jgi:hypothetical protein